MLNALSGMDETTTWMRALRRFAPGAAALCALTAAAALQASAAFGAPPDTLPEAPPRLSAIDALARALEPSERPRRRTVRIGEGAEIAFAPTIATGRPIPPEESALARLANQTYADAALAGAASLPRGALRAARPADPLASVERRIAALAAVEASAGRALSELTIAADGEDADMARALGVPFLAGRDRLAEDGGEAALACLAEAIYFEARSEPLPGQAAVAEVVLTRVDSAFWPDTVCDVVRQGEGAPGCQFSYVCDGKPETVEDSDAFADAVSVARLYLRGAPIRFTGHATHYHADYVSPDWARTMDQTAEIGVHRFFRRVLSVAAAE